MFSLAIRYNPTVTRYYENRSKAFRKVLNLDGARQDFICVLILDPTNEEVRSPMFTETVLPHIHSCIQLMRNIRSTYLHINNVDKT